MAPNHHIDQQLIEYIQIATSIYTYNIIKICLIIIYFMYYSSSISNIEIKIIICDAHLGISLFKVKQLLNY